MVRTKWKAVAFDLERKVKDLKLKIEHLEKHIRKVYFENKLLRSECIQLRTALTNISLIEDKMYGPDWEEIEEARRIATDALKSSS